MRHLHLVDGISKNNQLGFKAQAAPIQNCNIPCHRSMPNEARCRNEQKQNTELSSNSIVTFFSSVQPTPIDSVIPSPFKNKHDGIPQKACHFARKCLTPATIYWTISQSYINTKLYYTFKTQLKIRQNKIIAIS
jgi:hypothetical protein